MNKNANSADVRCLTRTARKAGRYLLLLHNFGHIQLDFIKAAYLLRNVYLIFKAAYFLIIETLLLSLLNKKLTC